MLLNMSLLEVDCPNYGQLVFYGNRIHDGYDCIFKSNCYGRSPDVVVFLDSRGVSRKYKGSLANQVVDLLERKNKLYLLITRPLNLTTWATLYNFLKLKGFKLVELPELGSRYTYDAVHYTDDGNRLIFNLFECIL